MHVWILGASSGIGHALAKAYAAKGDKVTVSARTDTALQALSAEDCNITPLTMDVLQPDAFEEAVQSFKQDLPDLVIYSAATYIPGGLEVLNHKEASHHMAVNYLAAVALTETITPHFKARGHGHLALIASLSGYCGLPNAALYGPTKAALINLCETLKADYDALGLRLSVVNPGFVKTPMTDKNEFSMPFLMTPEEAADKIIMGLVSNKFEITFPWPLATALRLLRKLPYSLYFKLTRRLIT